MYSTAGTDIKKLCIQNERKLLDASVRHLGTDINYIVLENLYKELKEKVEFRFNYRVDELEAVDGGYRVISGDSTDECEECIISVGRSGSKWMEKVCESLDIETNSNRVEMCIRDRYLSDGKYRCGSRNCPGTCMDKRRRRYASDRSQCNAGKRRTYAYGAARRCDERICQDGDQLYPFGK